MVGLIVTAAAVFIVVFLVTLGGIYLFARNNQRTGTATQSKGANQR